MLRLKPARCMRAFVVCGLALAMMLPGAAEAVAHDPGTGQNGSCTAHPGEPFGCSDGSAITSIGPRDRRRARRERPTDRHATDENGSFAEVARHGSQSYGEWLRIQMRSRSMTQRQLAHLTGVSHSSISRFLCSDRTPTLRTALAILAVFRQDPASIPVTVRVERVLRSDDRLDDEQVRSIMGAYLAMRRRSGDATRWAADSQVARVPKSD